MSHAPRVLPAPPGAYRPSSQVLAKTFAPAERGARLGASSAEATGPGLGRAIVTQPLTRTRTARRAPPSEAPASEVLTAPRLAHERAFYAEHPALERARPAAADAAVRTMDPVKLVIFDLDGTLIDSGARWARGALVQNVKRVRGDQAKRVGSEL